MPSYGLGNYNYDLTVEGGNAKFKFSDPEDSANTAEVVVNKSDFPEGISQADSREVSDLAYAKVEKSLNAKRDARLVSEQADATEQKTAEDKKTREAANGFLASAEQGTSKPDKVEKDKDGNVVSNVYTSEAKDKK